MKTVLARKEVFVGVGNAMAIVFGIAGILIFFYENIAEMLYVGAVVCVLGIVGCIRYCAVPSEILVLTEDGTAILTGDVRMPFYEITSASAKPIRRKSIRRPILFPWDRWGDILLYTATGKYRLRLVSECEETAERINRMIEESEMGFRHRPPTALEES